MLWTWLWLAEASPWIEEAGSVSIGLAASSLTSDRQFAGGEARGLTGPLCPEAVFPGDRMPYSCVTAGRYRQASATLNAAAGLGRSVALDVALPVVAASFEDSVDRTAAVGPGDARATVRVGTVADRLAIAAAASVQAPTGPGDFQDRDVPLGNGQWDLVPEIRLGYSLHPWGWAEVWQGWAVRLRNPETRIDPGDEWRGVAALGITPIPWGGLQLRTEALFARPDRDAFGLPHPGRRLIQLRAGPFVRPTPAGWIEIGVAAPVAGQRWPAAVVPYGSVLWRVR